MADKAQDDGDKQIQMWKVKRVCTMRLTALRQMIEHLPAAQSHAFTLRTSSMSEWNSMCQGECGNGHCLGPCSLVFLGRHRLAWDDGAMTAHSGRLANQHHVHGIFL